MKPNTRRWTAEEMDIIEEALDTPLDLDSLFVEDAARLDDDFDYDPYCFVCGRCTDHFAEHDDLVVLAMAEYTAQGEAILTPLGRADKLHGWPLLTSFRKVVA